MHLYRTPSCYQRQCLYPRLLYIIHSHLVPDFSHCIIKETPHHCIISCHTQSHGNRMAWSGNAAQQPVQSSGLPQDGTQYEEEMVQLNEGSTKRRKCRSKLRFKADTGDESSEPPSGRKAYRESSMRHKKKEGGGRLLRRERYEDFDSSSSDSSSEVTERWPAGWVTVAPHLQAFDGRATHWESFIFQFENLARSSGWSKIEKLESLQSCLRGKAVSFVHCRSEKVKGSYRRPECSLRSSGKESHADAGCYQRSPGISSKFESFWEVSNTHSSAVILGRSLSWGKVSRQAIPTTNRRCSKTYSW